MNILNNDILSSIKDPAIAKEILNRIRAAKINVLLVGGTGVGKSSTISALFQDYGNGQKSQAKVGQTASPETMDVSAHELDNLVIWDTPGLGDSTEKDFEHQRKIVDLLKKTGPDGKPLVDLIFLVLDAGSRDFSSAYTLIKDVVLPNLDTADRKRLLIGINQADMALKGRHWDNKEGKPEPKLVERLDELVQTVKSRIKNDTDLDVEPIYYVAGYKDGDEVQKPYNLQKLLSFILERLPEKKRATVAEHINQKQENFASNDDKEDYSAKVETSVLSSIASYAKEVLDEVYEKAKKFATDPEVIKAATDILVKSVVVIFKMATTKGK